MRKALLILGDLADEDIARLAAIGDVRDIAPQQTIIDAGAEPEALFFVTKGAFDVAAPGSDPIAQLGVGDVAGEMSFIEKRAPVVSVVASELARVIAIPRPAMSDALENSPAFAARFYKALATFLSDRLRTTTAKLNGDEADAAELDEHVLDVMHVAGERLHRLAALLEGREN